MTLSVNRVTTGGPDVIGSRYKKVSILGKGGLGEVMACDDTVLQRTVAVKAGHLDSEIDSYSTKIILAREAQIISCLEHPNIIPIYDAGTDPLRGPFYVMRQVTETSLEMILHQRKTGEGNPFDYTLNRLLRYFLQVCNAVDYAHHRGVIHCDIKPANILLGDYGEVLLVDWGLAQSRNHPLGVRGGTLGYMAPEQMDPSIERLDWRTDVFALGAIIYEILCGMPAFEDARKSDVTAMGKDPTRVYKAPAPPSSRTSGIEIPREVEDICMQAFAIDRDKRLETVRELANAIDEWIEGSKQKERQRIEADKSADTGDELAERYHEFVESRPEKLVVFRALRADMAPWAPLDDKQDLWDAEDIVRVTDALQVRTFHSAVSAYERALDAVPNHTRARRGLARLYWAELQRARHRGDALDQIAYEQLLREVDDGTFVRELQRDGVIELTFGAHAGKVTLGKLVERQRRLVEGSSEVIEQRPDARRSLAAGRYIVSSTIGDGPGTVAWPVNIEPGSLCRIHVDPPEVRGLGDGEV
jgi:serine/threonine protein kinase